ncbi:type II toxin-antitoxin system PemK/MazF family toxin [Amantichitinum ursilacus]|uniref:PemK-like protein n=1 Tax=Amantichitinum ursilacus TaxID=857265 RepID=A0A0N0GPX1_9NEIS|nr:type II toxin-antitoxin system PemK/MazF family toxin [Amantichitinum ursilacus]KPC54194.1 hypothetical protein WG78_06075 [Amantichitinum ursilacus]
MTIQIQYLERTSSGCVLLGEERLEQIDEALIPMSPSDAAPVFMSKKFSGRAEYRWQVAEVAASAAGVVPAIFYITLKSRPQPEKRAWLTCVMASSGRRAVSAILVRGCLVEVEYDHPMTVAKSNGQLRSNKRYPETIQAGSMPKRRLAIVLRALAHGPGRGIVQVIPISSAVPAHGDHASVDITAALQSLLIVDYQKQSWAKCQMIETVSATRILAPRVKFPGRVPAMRDTGFKTRLNKTWMGLIEDALVYGVTLQALVTAKNTKLKALESTVVKLEEDIAHLRKQLDCQTIANAEAMVFRRFTDYLETRIGSLDDEWTRFRLTLAPD